MLSLGRWGTEEGGRPAFYHLPLGSFRLLTCVATLLSWKQTFLIAEELRLKYCLGSDVCKFSLQQKHMGCYGELYPNGTQVPKGKKPSVAWREGSFPPYVNRVTAALCPHWGPWGPREAQLGWPSPVPACVVTSLPKYFSVLGRLNQDAYRTARCGVAACARGLSTHGRLHQSLPKGAGKTKAREEAEAGHSFWRGRGACPQQGVVMTVGANWSPMQIL